MNGQQYLLLDQLADLCRSAEDELLLVAPFAKVHVVEKLLAAVQTRVQLNLVVRWLPQDVLSGATDLDIWLLVKDRPRARMFIRQDLHAKYYATGNRCLIGSANLTGRGLGASRVANLELLIEVDRLPEFEVELWRGTTQVSDELYGKFTNALEGLAAEIEAPSWELGEVLPPSIQPTITWTPRFRHPEDLFAVYSGTATELSSSALAAGYDDLAMLRPPPGLDEEAFVRVVSAVLQQLQIIAYLENLLQSGPLRFGAVRDAVERFTNSAEDVTLKTQGLYRWLSYFLSDVFVVERPNYSEVLRLRRN